MSNPTDLINAATATATSTAPKSTARKAKGSGLAINEQVRGSAIASAKSSVKAARVQAQNDAIVFTQTYVEETQRYSEVIGQHVAKARESMFAAIAQGGQEPEVFEEESDFLGEFERALRSQLES